MNTALVALKESLKPYQNQLLNHPINKFINSFEDLERFMQVHSFAVWDFMSLVKKLQAEFTCTQLPWKPVGNPITRRLINEIVFGEESDVDRFGNATSHFELYLEAMNELGIKPLSELSTLLEAQTLDEVIAKIDGLNLDERVKQFLHFTFSSIQHKSIHEIAAIFTFGREDLIPSMFTEIVEHLRGDETKQIDGLIYYLDRHIEVDGDSHAHLAYDMLIELCGTDSNKWKQAQEAAIESLTHRILLWDAIVDKK